MGEGEKLKTADIRSRLLIDVVEFGLLGASDVKAGIGEEGVDGVFASLVIKTAGVPISNGEIMTDHNEV
jgi:hypothetical protein